MAALEVEFKKFLGRGSFGSVSLFQYKGRQDGYVAVKTSDDEHAKALYREFQILSEFKGCSRIVQCYGNRVQKRYYEDGYVEYKIPMEYASGGSLRDFTDRFKDRKLPEPLIKEFTRMLLEGLAIIHRHGYVHCDLKPENILVFPTCVYKNGERRWFYELKISDFGLSKRDGDNKWWEPRHPFAGTPIYMSPESVSHGETGKGLDLWSLGCVVLEMYTGKSPWSHRENDDLEDLKKCLKKCYAPLIPNDLPCDAKLFIMTCFAFEPDERKDALTLLRHSFLRGDVNKITKLQVNQKIDNPKDFVLKLEKIRQMLSEIRSIR
ncbi:Mitogen-activated protein kinase kinase kinase 20 [Cardamine amara subsp. amara]|uniref:Mitogen-activated protein kinase kinase kinase 20 n=1 Tax=Cardamine amara subsp. amara TaxID=228776 RepID=A0ABD1AJW4_CARAN